MNTGCQEPFPDRTELPMIGHEMVRDHRVDAVMQQTLKPWVIEKFQFCNRFNGFSVIKKLNIQLDLVK